MGYINSLGNYRIGDYLSAQGRATYIQFDGTAYAEHAPFTPMGVNFSASLRYTPAAADIGNLVTILGAGVLEKDASNNLVFSYTDTVAGAQSVTLSALTLVADTEYLIEVSSDGNGVSITVGADTALNAAVIDPSTLVIESWMGAANPSAGVIRDINFVDGSVIQNGEFLPGDGTDLSVALSTITLSGDFRITFDLIYSDSDPFGAGVIGDRPSGDPDGSFFIANLAAVGNTLECRLIAGGTNYDASVSGLANGQHYKMELSLIGGVWSSKLDGKAGNQSTSVPDRDYYFTGVYKLVTGAYSACTVANLNIELLTNGNTYEYRLNDIVDLGGGQGLAPNKGNTGSSFDGIVHNYDPLTDLVQIPPNTRQYLTPAVDNNIQEDVLNADGPELFVPTSLDAGWTDNGDGSYSWDSSSIEYINCGTVLTAGKHYLATFETVSQTGASNLGFSFSGVIRESYNTLGVHSAVLVGGTNLRFFFTGTGTGTVRNISVRETTSAEIINYQSNMFIPS